MKGRYRMIAFDFDGTLVDTAPDIADTANLVLERHGFAARDLDQVKEAIGKGVRDLMQRLIKPKAIGDSRPTSKIRSSATSPGVALTRIAGGSLHRRPSPVLIP